MNFSIEHIEASPRVTVTNGHGRVIESTDFTVSVVVAVTGALDMGHAVIAVADAINMRHEDE